MLTRAPAGFRLGPALSRQCRLNSTTSKPLSSRSQVAPTTFSEKASPRNVHDRPEQIRGFPVSPPPRGVKTDGATPRERPQPTLSREEAFDGPSKPRMMYARQSQRELPDFKNRTRIYIALGVIGALAWGGFLLYATNAERLASSVMRSLQFHLRNSEEVREAMGTRVKLEEPWYVLGDPWITGKVNLMQGRVDLKFRIKGDNDAGTVYFTSLRPSQADPWRIVRYKLITDKGETLRLENNISKI